MIWANESFAQQLWSRSRGWRELRKYRMYSHEPTQVSDRSLGRGHGGGLCGQRVRRRRSQKTGGLGIVSADSALPCERPPLSKGLLAGKENETSVLINPEGFYRAHSIGVHLNLQIERRNRRESPNADHTRCPRRQRPLSPFIDGFGPAARPVEEFKESAGNRQRIYRNGSCVAECAAGL